MKDNEELYECFAYFMDIAHHNCKKAVIAQIHKKHAGNCSKECEAKTNPYLVMSVQITGEEE